MYSFIIALQFVSSCQGTRSIQQILTIFFNEYTMKIGKEFLDVQYNKYQSNISFRENLNGTVQPVCTYSSHLVDTPAPCINIYGFFTKALYNSTSTGFFRPGKNMFVYRCTI